MTSPRHRRVALLVAAAPVAVLVLTGCSGSSGSSTAAPATPSAAATDQGLGGHTPDPLGHPCDIVTSKVASRLLGVAVKAKRIHDAHTGRAQDCGYNPVEQGSDTPFLEVVSTPDPTPLSQIVGLYLGVDRLPHHPVDVAGADGAEVIVDSDPTAPGVTMFVKQGYVTHTIVLGLLDVGRAEKIAVRTATLLVAGNGG